MGAEVAKKIVKTTLYNLFYPFRNKNDYDFIEDFSFVNQPNKPKPMKNTLLALIFSFIGLGMYAQEGFKIGFHGGLPIDDFNDAVSLSLALDAGYMFALGEVVDLGVSTGFIHGFAETFDSQILVADLPNMQFVPLSASVRIWPSNSLSIGIDAGQAFGINEGNDGGLYYRPILGYLMGAFTELNFSYTTINMDNDLSWNSVNLGLLFTIPNKKRL